MPPPEQYHSWVEAASTVIKKIEDGTEISFKPNMEFQDNSCCTASKVKRMEDNVNETQLAAAFSEGWGQRGINQDTAWDVPSSPQCSPKEGSSWSSSTSTGTEIWESNVRHHIKTSTPKAASQIREPWNHTPSTHIGGTWGEEEDTTNLWTGVPPASATAWGGESNTSVWGANPIEGKGWNNQNPTMNPNWGAETSALQIGLPHMPLNSEKSIDDPGLDSGPPWGDPSHKLNHTFGSWSPVTGGTKKPMPPSGWEETPPPATCQAGTSYDDGTAVWGNPVHQGKVSHWKEMPPAKQMPNCVMPPGNLCQTGNPCVPHVGPGMIRLPQSGATMNKTDNAWMKNQPVNRGLGWAEVPTHRDPSGRRIWEDIRNPLQDKTLPGNPNMPNSAFPNWGEPNHAIGSYWGAKTKPANCSWAEGQVDTSSWGGPLKQGGKPLSKDLIWASKQFRLLAEMNFKKDDIENALRRSNMNFEEALLELHALSNKEGSMLDIDSLNTMNINQPRMHHSNIDDMPFTEHAMENPMPPGNMYGSSNFPGMTMLSAGFNIAQSCKQNTMGNAIAPNILGNAGTANQVPNFSLNNGINNVSPGVMRKMVPQNQAFNPACLPQNTLNNQAGRLPPQNFPSTAQLRLLVQQIQMAVQTGHLNPQILNQPLAPQTLQLLFQLLQQIRFLHQLQQQQIYYTQHGNKPGSPPLQLSVQITQAKQHIVNLQNQIAAQQALFLKQQVQVPMQHPSLQTPQPSTFDMKSNLDSINGLTADFRDLAVKEPGSQGHSRLNQWKLPSFEKEENPSASENPCNRDTMNSANEFSRAPGGITKSSSANSLASTTASHSSSNLQPLGENAWSDNPRMQNDNWSEAGESANSVSVSSENVGSSNDNSDSAKHNSASDNTESPVASSNPSTSSSSQSYNLNDLVPEFEPGKPWKGTSRIKNCEDDPHITPGSIAKSPLSLNSIKEPELFAWNTKQSASSASTLTSSTWTFSPPSTVNQNRSWGSRSADQLSWKGGPMPKSRGPPTGLTGQNKPVNPNMLVSESAPQGWSSNSGWEKQSCSSFLVLKNLTPQIDGSTLKTLCQQHGPLQFFHLLLNHGIALVCYSSSEETENAYCALNNCVLSNTTILADIPNDLQLKQYFQLASEQMAATIPSPPGNYIAGNDIPVNGSTNHYDTPDYDKISTSNWNSTSGDMPCYPIIGSADGCCTLKTATSNTDQYFHSSLSSFLPGDLLGSNESI